MGRKFRILLVTVLLTFFLPSLALSGDNYTGFLHNESTMIPVRGVFQSMGAKVNWLPDTEEVVIEKDGLQVVLQVNNKEAMVNGTQQWLEVAPIIRDGSIYLPLRFVAEALGAKVDWEPDTGIALITYRGNNVQVKVAQSVIVPKIKLASFSKKINGINITGVVVPANAGLKAKAALANGQVGTTQSLADMARTNNAVVAINGTFFSAYDGVPVPWNQLIMDGKVVHIGNTGSTFGFTREGRVKLEKLRLKIDGATEGSFSYPNGWYAFGVNHWPGEGGNLSYIFTPVWGKTLGFSHGKHIVVTDGLVTEIADGEDVEIPINGYVISLHGSERYLESRFTIGTAVSYKVSYTNNHGHEVDWSDVVTAVGAGPSLVKDGKVIVDPTSEGFTEAKILSQSMGRSAIGITAQGDIILVNTTATVQALAEIMKELGAENAMNLDGGASAGIYLNGSYLVTPGRNLSNALIFIE